MIELLVEASYLPKEEKITSLKHASNKLEVLKVFFRLLHELKVIDQKKYIDLQSRIQEIGKMFGGWMKSIKPADAGVM